MDRGAPKLQRMEAMPNAAGNANRSAALGLDDYERDVLAIARHFFEAFSHPASHAWIEAFRGAERIFPVPFGASIANAILIAINAMRVNRRRAFQFERPGSLSAETSLTDDERYFMGVLHEIRRGNRASARVHALFLCEGNEATHVLAAVERLAIITGDVDEPHFN